jgi:hypothetical protein
MNLTTGLPFAGPGTGLPNARYFFLPGEKVGCHVAVFWLGAAAMTLIFSFLGFLVSRLPRRSPLLMLVSVGRSRCLN